MPRIPVISPRSDLTPKQRSVVDAILGKRGGGAIPGPFRFALHCPELTEVWFPLGEMMRWQSSFPLRLSEFAILLAARGMDCDYVFNVHTPQALKGGLPQSVIDALVRGERPAFEQPDEEAMYDYCTELLEHHAVSDKTYARALEAFGVRDIVELTALVGYYTMVTMTIVAHELPLPEGARLVLAKRA